MSKRINDIQDDDFRIIGSTQSEALKIDKSKGKTRWYIYMLAIVICLAAGLTLLLTRAEEPAQEAEVEVVFDPMPIQQEEPIEEEIKPLGDYDEGDSKAYTEHLRDTINDIPLDIYIPHNAVPELMVGVPDIHDKTIILTTQAADVRADNGKIVGAFVVNGKPLSWGLSKKGYCGIIDGELTVGVADNSPLFEEATEKGGYFFRQYPLVDNGVLVENEPKNKSMRRALCERAGEIFVVISNTPESFHDFAQALVDLGVNQAVYLVGSSAYGWAVDESGMLHEFGEDNYYTGRRRMPKNTSYIVWKKR